MIFEFIRSLCLQPERLEGVHYSVQSDIWSLGLSLIEMAIGVYPIPPPDPKLIDQILSENLPPPEPKIMSFFAQLEHISTAPAPRLEHKSLSPEFTDFLDQCLQKEPEQRADLKTLLVSKVHFTYVPALLSSMPNLNRIEFCFNESNRNIHGSKSMSASRLTSPDGSSAQWTCRQELKIKNAHTQVAAESEIER